MTSKSALHKSKLTVTISGDVVDEIDVIAKKKDAPRSQVMEEALRYWLRQSRKQAIEKDIESYYLSRTEKEKKEDGEWVKTTTESARRTWDD